MKSSDMCASLNEKAAPAQPAKLDEQSRAWLPKFSTATTLTALAGFNDAIGYAALGHLYLSFMSGNSTRFGMSVADGDWSDMFLAGSIIVMFVVGSFTGAIISDRHPEAMAQRILGIETAIVLGAGLGSYLGAGPAALIPVAAAMGMQNVLHQVIGGADVGKGFITGSLFGLGQSLARWVLGKGQGQAAFQNGWSWLSFVAGVSTGASVYGALGLSLSLSAVAIVLAVMLALTQRSTLKTGAEV